MKSESFIVSELFLRCLMKSVGGIYNMDGTLHEKLIQDFNRKS
jgi:hypothetical protein